MKCPVRPPFSYAGGKHMIAKWVISHLPRSGVKRYVETCVGSGAILCALDKPYPEEIINDLDGGVSSFWLALRDHSEELIRKKELTPYSRVEWLAAREKIRNKGYPEDICEAARLFLTMTCQNYGRIATTNSGWRMPKPQTTRTIGSEWRRLSDEWRDVAIRIRDVSIERADMVDLVRRHGGKDTLLYLDPPYLLGSSDSKRCYGELGDPNHEALAKVLRSSESMVAISGYPSAEYDSWLMDWGRVDLSTIARIGTQSGLCAARTECLWINPAAQAALARDGQQLSLFE